MKKAAILVTLLFSIAFVNAQEKRTVSDFTKLNVKGFFDVKLVSSGDLTIASNDPEIIKEIKTEVQNGTLSIYLEGKNKYKHAEVTITIPFKSLDEVILAGSGSIDSDKAINSENFIVKLTGSGDISLEVTATSVNASVTGSGDVKLKGKTKNFKVDVSGSGDMEAFELVSDDTEVTVTGSGDALVYAKENLKARVNGSGDIEVRGNPKKEDTKVSGSGSIQKG